MPGFELKPIKLTDKAEEWLSIFLEDALQQGLSGTLSHIPDEVYSELIASNIIELRSENYGKVNFTDQFVNDVTRRMNLYGLLRSLLVEGMFPCSKGLSAYQSPAVDDVEHEPIDIDLYFVVMQHWDSDSGDEVLFKALFDEGEANTYYEQVKASNPTKTVSLLSHSIEGLYFKADVEKLEARVSQLELFKQVCGDSSVVKDERIKQLETENEALRAVIRLTV